MNLLIDIGNSRLKWSTAQSGIIAPVQAVDYRQSDLTAELYRLWRDLAGPEKLVIASVGHADLQALVIELAGNLWPDAEMVLPRVSSCAFGVSNAYAQPESLGIDRWLAMVAAHHYYPGNNCIVDCGTALTLDAVNKRGEHLGGLICPGLNIMKNSLIAETAALSADNGTGLFALGATTADCIDNATLFAAVGMVEACLNRQLEDYQLILTGGDAGRLVDGFHRRFILDEQLVFKGLSIFCTSTETA